MGRGQGLWHLFVQKQAFSLSAPRKGGFAAAFGVGLLMCAVIWGAFWLFGRGAVSPDLLREKVGALGLDRPAVYLAASLYWICVNSLLEEYVFRFFLYRQCEILLRGVRWAAVGRAACRVSVQLSVVAAS